MAPTPSSKGKGVHKSSGKIFRKKDQESGSSSSSKKEDSGSNGASSSSSTFGSSVVELKECALTLPFMAGLDHLNSLPRYTSLLMASNGTANGSMPGGGDNGSMPPAVCNGDTISMEELDNLQLELELLASSMLVRQNTLTGQLAIIDQLEKGKVVARVASPVKRLKTDSDHRPTKKAKDNNGKAKDVNHPLPPAPYSTPPPPPSKIAKVKCSIVRNEPTFDVPDLPCAEPPRPPPPRNDITNRFWAMVDTYCQEMTAEDIKLLEDLITGHNDDADVYKVQPLGKHYTLRWAQEDLMDEQKEGSKLAEAGNGSKKKGGNTAAEVPDKLLREVDLNHSTGDDTAPLGPLAQRLLAGLVEEKVLLQPENAENKVGVGRPGFLRSLGLGSGAGLEKRLRRELQDQGIIEAEHPGQEEDDEILLELRRCQTELRAVSGHNHTQLTRLLRLARDALFRHDLKKKLRDAEAKVIEAYKNISSLRAKKKPPCKKDKEAAWKAIKDREGIVRQLDSITS